jgi:hypothetical protein
MIASEGMTFTIKKRELTENGDQKWLHEFPLATSDFIVTETPCVVPNGKWVMERWVTPAGFDDFSPVTTHFVGNYKGLTTIELERDGQSSRNLYVSDLPFGTISSESLSEVWRTMDGVYFTSAKQIHKGELGQLVPIPQLNYVREDKAEVRPWARGKRKSRSHIGWGKLSDLIEATGLSFEEIIERFWPFVDFKTHAAQNFPSALTMLTGVTADEIKRRNRLVYAYTKQEILDRLQQDPDAYNDVWIREGLIKTILRLIALGYVPKGTSINA